MLTRWRLEPGQDGHMEVDEYGKWVRSDETAGLEQRATRWEAKARAAEQAFNELLREREQLREEVDNLMQWKIQAEAGLRKKENP